MLKAPVAGRVKSRLGREVGMVPAAWWYRHLLRRLLRRLPDPRWNLILAVTPDHFRAAGYAVVPQGRGDLGTRMLRLIDRMPTGPVLIVGSDIPGLDRRAVARAFRALAGAEVVLGPAPDGGYWALGANRPRRWRLDGVRWSTDHALADTLRALKGRRVALTGTLADVDTAEDLRMVSARSPW